MVWDTLCTPCIESCINISKVLRGRGETIRQDDRHSARRVVKTGVKERRVGGVVGDLTPACHAPSSKASDFAFARLRATSH